MRILHIFDNKQYQVAGIFRTRAEREVASQIGSRKTLGPY